MERYSRQILFSPIGKSGQKALLQSSALVVGTGALGTVISNHLVRAGIGKIRIVDRDYVELSNLQRQMLFDEHDVLASKPKAIAAKEKLQKINKDTHIEAIIEHVSAKNIDELTKGIDIIFDGTDNFQTRYLLNDIAYKKGIPFAYGGVISSRGMSALFIPKKTPCLRCIMKQPANDGQTCDTVGVIGPAVHIVSSLQVTEGLKYLTENDENLRDGLLNFDIWTNEFTEIKFTKPDPFCLTCKQEQYPALERKAEEDEVVLCGRNIVQIHTRQTMNLNEWQEKMSKVATTHLTPFLLQVNFSQGIKFIIFSDGRVLVQGTEDIVKARTWYDRYIGS